MHQSKASCSSLISSYSPKSSWYLLGQSMHLSDHQTDFCSASSTKEGKEWATLSRLAPTVETTAWSRQQATFPLHHQITVQKAYSSISPMHLQRRRKGFVSGTPFPYANLFALRILISESEPTVISQIPWTKSYHALLVWIRTFGSRSRLCQNLSVRLGWYQRCQAYNH